MTTGTTKFVCLHGHFYQPPRENAWLETIEIQDSAAPYHDWNERINEECYAPNATARILNGEQQIREVSNNYVRISWNMGPTLLSWLEQHDPATYQRIQAADRLSRKQFGGHGSAVAQSYNHIIMPLANARDRQTQIKWGIADFTHRFGRAPEGMWLAETAVDTACLEALVDNGIRYTILAPRQCKSVRKGKGGDWRDVNGGVDTRRPYRCVLPSGRNITLFFYDGEVAKAVAFEGLLNDGRLLADRLMNSLDDNEEVQLAHIATDGESYGHHHRRGEMALASCLDVIDDHPDVQLTNYGAFLADHPPTWEAQIHENSSWSCVHGVERWRSDCGCETGGEPGWHQRWRKPLRRALDTLRDQLIEVFEREGKPLFTDVWAARDAYIDLVLDRAPGRSDAFLIRFSRKAEISPDERVKMLRLLEMQRHAMLMYTSCAWFFNEVTGIETLQVLQYANRAIHLCQVISGKDYHTDFIAELEDIESNVLPNAAVAYRDTVMPARVGLFRVGMHFAAASLFEEDPSGLELFNYRSKIHHLKQLRAGSFRLSVGRLTILSNITHSYSNFSFAVLYLGQQAMIGEICRDMQEEEYSAVLPELEREFRVGHVSEVINLMRDHFGGQSFSIWHLFRDEKQKILLEMTERTLEIAAANFSDIYYDNYQLMSTMRANGMPLPDSYLSAIAFTLRRRLLDLLTGSELIDRPRLRRLVTDHLHWAHEYRDRDRLEKAASDRVHELIRHAFTDSSYWSWICELLTALTALGVQADFYRAQDEFLEGWIEAYVARLDRASREAGLAVARELELQVGFVPNFREPVSEPELA
jgi:alpha-amylase/alpha-mannosidase (GH57 family)